MGKENFLTLADIKTGDECVIVKVHGHGSFRNRIIEMGFVKGVSISVVKNAPLSDPIEYKLLNSHISLRRSEAELIEVVHISNEFKENFNGTFTEEDIFSKIKERSNTIDIALVGNPNSGKTTLFNKVTGLNEKVGNYSGVTVDIKKQQFNYKDYTINLVDLPGTYSLTDYSAEETFVNQYIIEHHPDIVLNVVDASALERNLFLTTQLIDMNIKVVMALNMYDELEREGSHLNYDYLGQLMGIPIIPIVAKKGRGLDDLLDKVIEAFEDAASETRHVHIHYGQSIEKSVKKIKSEVVKNQQIIDLIVPRYASIKLLENDPTVHKLLKNTDNYNQIKKIVEQEVRFLEKEYKDDAKTIVANEKYGFIRGALRETYKPGETDNHERSNRIDNLLTHKWFGFPCLVFFMWLTFQLTFTLGQYPMSWIEMGVTCLGDFVANSMQDGPLKNLLVDGIIAGVGGVIVFLPNILILFFCISLMEASGYMARAVFIMDRFMHKIGLHGKSFIPMLIGFGCTVPAIMATRTLESKRDRLITMLIIPFMSCGARLPVYTLFIGAFFVKNQGLVLASIYFIGVFIAILTAWLFKKTIFKKSSDPFVMELPPYRVPSLRSTASQMWNKGAQYLKKMGTVILLASIIIWALGYFPVNNDPNLSDVQKMEQSYIGTIGKTIEPVMAPLGFDWKMSVGIVTGVAAKEVVVSTIAVLYETDDEDSLIPKLQAQKDEEGNQLFTPLVAYAFMLFVLIYFPCVAVVAAVKNEAGWKWAGFTIVYTTALAWLVAFAVFQIGNLFA